MNVEHCGASVSKQYNALIYISRLFSEVSGHSTQVVGHVAANLITLLSTKVLNSLGKMVVETSLAWVGTIQCSC